jgi:hypothetical protein
VLLGKITMMPWLWLNPHRSLTDEHGPGMILQDDEANFVPQVSDVLEMAEDMRAVMLSTGDFKLHELHDLLSPAGPPLPQV